MSSNVKTAHQRLATTQGVDRAREIISKNPDDNRDDLALKILRSGPQLSLEDKKFAKLHRALIISEQFWNSLTDEGKQDPKQTAKVLATELAPQARGRSSKTGGAKDRVDLTLASMMGGLFAIGSLPIIWIIYALFADEEISFIEYSTVPVVLIFSVFFLISIVTDISVEPSSKKASPIKKPIQSEQHNPTIGNVFGECRREHEEVLVRKYHRSVIVDDYGLEDHSKWIEEIEYFCNKIVLPKLKHHRISVTNELITKAINDHLDRPIRKIAKTKAKSIANYSPSMTGIEYEVFCSNILKRAGWAVEPTKVSGDQGADIVARRDGTTVVFQCKRYSKPVGNKAVQEVVAARNHYLADHMAVIATNGFTKSALSLAQSNRVDLLHHSDLARWKVTV